MNGRFLMAMTLALSVLFATTGYSEPERVTSTSLKGSVGKAGELALKRFHQPPFTSLQWLRADLTGEKVSQYDNKWGHTMHRPFKNYSGDISGRYLEVMALVGKSKRPDGLFDQLLQDTLKNQHPDGSFCSTGPVDWQKRIGAGMNSKMMPALWGNARMLCGLVEGYRESNSDEVLKAARKLGDFYTNLLPRMTDPERMREFLMKDTYASGYVTCYFPAIEGLVKLHQLCGEKSYLETAVAMAKFYEQFDKIPIDHAHGMLCCHVGLLGIFEATGDDAHLKRVEQRWDALVAGGYINPAGGILEKCRPVFERDEGCTLADWLRINLDLARITGKPRYWDMAERVLQNHFLLNQAASGGFGHRYVKTDGVGVVGMKQKYNESTWCCCFHGLLGFELLKRNLCSVKDDTVHLPLPLNFTCAFSGQNVSSACKQSGKDSFQQLITLKQPALLSVRKPAWAKTVAVRDGKGNEISTKSADGWLRIDRPVSSVEIIYGECIYTEEHPPQAQKGKRTFTYLGPWIMDSDNKLPAVEHHTRTPGKPVGFSCGR